jgi:putative ABC transport system permease protein
LLQLSGKSFALLNVNVGLLLDPLSMVMLLVVTGATLLAGLAAGSYPALFLSSLPPSSVLKGGYAAGRPGRSSSLRRALVVAQFSISIVFIIGAALLFERAVTVSGFHRALGLLVEYCKTTKRDGKPLAADPLIAAFSGSSALYTISVNSIIAVALAGSIFYTRFWCRYLCPVGAFLSLLNNFIVLNRIIPKRDQ